MSIQPYTVSWKHDGKIKSVQLNLSDIASIVSQDETKIVEQVVTKKGKKKCTTCGAKGIKELLINGAKLLKAELGIDACDEATIIHRRNLCESCEYYDFGVCDKCSCFCSAKVKLKSEKCPEGKW